MVRVQWVMFFLLRQINWTKTTFCYIVPREQAPFPGNMRTRWKWSSSTLFVLATVRMISRFLLEAPDHSPRSSTPFRPSSLFPFPPPPSLLPEGSLNWHRFRTAPDSKSLPKCFHSATPVAALRSLQADRLREKLFHEAAVAWDVGFAFRGTRGFPLFFPNMSPKDLGAHYRQRIGGAMWVSQMDALSWNPVFIPAQKRPVFEGPILGSRTDASESTCGRIQSDSFFLLRLGGVENFPQHIPGLRQQRESELR